MHIFQQRETSWGPAHFLYFKHHKTSSDPLSNLQGLSEFWVCNIICNYPSSPSSAYSTWGFDITLQKPWKLQRKKPSKFALTNFLGDWKLKGFSMPGSIQESAAVWFCFFRQTLQNLYEL